MHYKRKRIYFIYHDTKRITPGYLYPRYREESRFRKDDFLNEAVSSRASSPCIVTTTKRSRKSILDKLFFIFDRNNTAIVKLDTKREGCAQNNYRGCFHVRCNSTSILYSFKTLYSIYLYIV